MGFINLAEKTVNAKLVYYGVGLGGKTTSLKSVHGIMCPKDEVKLVSINTEQDSTLLFDFLPIDLGQVEGFKIRVRGFTVPGQAQYVVMRKYVLSGADAVVMVFDTQKDRIEENLEAIEDLKMNLAVNGLDWQTIPLVIQYNKRDLPDVLPEEELDKLFRFREVPVYLSARVSLKRFPKRLLSWWRRKSRTMGSARETSSPARSHVSPGSDSRALSSSRTSRMSCVTKRTCSTSLSAMTPAKS